MPTCDAPRRPSRRTRGRRAEAGRSAIGRPCRYCSGDVARHPDAVLPEDVLHEAAAVEARRVGAAVAVGRAPQREGRSHDGVARAVGGTGAASLRGAAAARWPGGLRASGRGLVRRPVLAQPPARQQRPKTRSPGRIIRSRVSARGRRPIGVDGPSDLTCWKHTCYARRLLDTMGPYRAQ